MAFNLRPPINAEIAERLEGLPARLTRLAHAYVHCTSNDLRFRASFYGVGALVLAIMWLIFMVRIMLGLP